jgi:(5-formylfuran-3-yl)methyl phosphate synthase
MTGMLASVTSIKEAQLVLNYGVDIIDLKNPELGALGALDTNVVSAIVESISRACLTSATIGDIEPNNPSLYELIVSMANTGVDYVKVGLFDDIANERFVEVLNKASEQNIKVIVVLFAENYSSLASLDNLMRSGISGVMLDTKNKSDKNLLSLLNRQELDEFIQLAKSHGLVTGLAGSLRYEDIKSLLGIEADYLGFRGALCSENDRVKSIETKNISKIRKAITQQNAINYGDAEFRNEVLSNGSMA